MYVLFIMFEIPLYRVYYNIMKTERYSSHTLRKLLKAQKIASMSELKEALGTLVDVTVFRKLAELGYRTSYSNRGQYTPWNRSQHSTGGACGPFALYISPSMVRFAQRQRL